MTLSIDASVVLVVTRVLGADKSPVQFRAEAL